MAKDKLITVRINEALYNQFKEWTETNNSNISDTLRKYILSCLDDKKSIQKDRQLIDTDLSSQLDDKIKNLSSQLETTEARLYSHLYTNLANDLSRLLDRQKIYSEGLDSKKTENIDNNIDNYIDSLGNELVVSENSEKETTAKTAQLALTPKELAKRLKLKHHVPLSSRYCELSESDFIEWSRSLDPEKIGWYKTRSEKFYTNR